MNPQTDAALDPLGHALLARRLTGVPALLDAVARRPFPAPSAAVRASRGFIVTGTGSSEAHARFLVYLLNRHAQRPAQFMPLSAFCDLPDGAGRGQTLVVISQGLSPNAQVAVNRHRDFAHTVLFTSTTAAGAEAAGKPDRAALVRALEAGGVEFVRGPMEEEYSTLIRFVGPMAGYLDALRFVAALAPDALPPVDPDALAVMLATPAGDDLVDRFAAEAAGFRRGFYLLASAPLCEFAHNLSYKFLEGLFWSAPVLWDFLQFAHGPFQEVTLQPRPVVILEGPGATERELAARTRRMLEAAQVPCIDLAVPQATPLSIFAWEALFNDLVLRLIVRLGVDQRHWPSKGRDDPLYGFYRVG